MAHTYQASLLYVMVMCSLWSTNTMPVYSACKVWMSLSMFEITPALDVNIADSQNVVFIVFWVLFFVKACFIIMKPCDFEYCRFILVSS